MTLIVHEHKAACACLADDDKGPRPNDEDQSMLKPSRTRTRALRPMPVYYDTGSGNLIRCDALSITRDPDHRIMVTLRLPPAAHPLRPPRWKPADRQIAVLAQFVYPRTPSLIDPHGYRLGYDWASLVPNVGDTVTL